MGKEGIIVATCSDCGGMACKSGSAGPGLVDKSILEGSCCVVVVVV